ncbi:MAG: hypothetical protein CYG60_20130 [Actinobacteria bacterium]|nr:MAG: hypothetical protein CYG60_20130 [Actinomycetota bacterium]
MDIGKRVRTAREARGITQEELARRAGVPLNRVGRIETGAVTDPHYSTLSRIADGLGVSVAELLLEEPVPLAEAPEAGPAITRDSLMSSPESEKERREELREFREFLLEVHALLEEIVEKYKAAGDNDKLTTLLNVLIFNAWGAEQFVKEEIGLPEDRETRRVYNAGAHLQDLIDDLREDLQEGQVVGPAEEPKDDLFMKRLLRKQAG